MHLADRRKAMRLALSAAFAAQLASRSAWADTGADEPFAPPSDPMIYRRTLERQLSDGEVFRVERAFLVHFGPQGSGYRVEGNQISAAVQAPESLSTFADLEERRVETGVFPLVLDHRGHIVDGEGDYSSPELEMALEEVRRRLGLNEDGPVDELQQLVTALHQAGAQMIAELPLDLFAPDQPVRHMQRQITLPWGDSGEVSTHFEAQRDPQTGLMREASREVVTLLAGDRRRSVEHWTLERS